MIIMHRGVYKRYTCALYIRTVYTRCMRVYPTVRHVHIGDAPADVRAGEAADGEPGPAQAVEAFSIGVTTGLFGRPKLEAVAKCTHEVEDRHQSCVSQFALSW